MIKKPLKRPLPAKAIPPKVVLPKIVLPEKKSIVAMKITDHISMFYGPPGIGKTTLVNELAPAVLFISTDRGTRSISSMRVEVNDWYGIDATLTALEKPDAPHYGIICIDHVDDVVNMIEESVLTELGIESLGDKDIGWGVGWKAYKRRIFSLLNRIKALNSGIVFIAHETVKKLKVNGVERDVTQPNMGKSAYNLVVPLADLIGFCGIRSSFNAETKTRENYRYLRTEPTTDVYAKDRTRRVRRDDELYEPLSGKYLLSTFNDVKEPSHAYANSTTPARVTSHQQQGRRANGQANRPTNGRRAAR